MHKNARHPPRQTVLRKSLAGGVPRILINFIHGMINSSLLTFTPLTASMYQSKAHSKFHALLAIVYDNRHVRGILRGPSVRDILSRQIYVCDMPSANCVILFVFGMSYSILYVLNIKLLTSSLGTLVFLGFVGSRRLVLVFLLLGFCRLP